MLSHRTGSVIAPHNARVDSFKRSMSRLAARWARKLEIEASEYEHAERASRSKQQDRKRYRSLYEGLTPEMKVVDFSNVMLAAQLTNKQYDCYSLAKEYQRPMSEVEQRIGLTRKTIHEHIAAAEKAMGKLTVKEYRAKTAAKHKRPE